MLCNTKLIRKCSVHNIPSLGDEVVVIDGQRPVVVHDEGAAVRGDVLHALDLVAEPEPALNVPEGGDDVPAGVEDVVVLEIRVAEAAPYPARVPLVQVEDEGGDVDEEAEEDREQEEHDGRGSHVGRGQRPGIAKILVNISVNFRRKT